MYLQSLSIYASILSTTDSNDCKPKDPVSCLKKMAYCPATFLG